MTLVHTYVRTKQETTTSHDFKLAGEKLPEVEQIPLIYPSKVINAFTLSAFSH